MKSKRATARQPLTRNAVLFELHNFVRDFGAAALPDSLIRYFSYQSLSFQLPKDEHSLRIILEDAKTASLSLKPRRSDSYAWRHMQLAASSGDSVQSLSEAVLEKEFSANELGALLSVHPKSFKQRRSATIPGAHLDSLHYWRFPANGVLDYLISEPARITPRARDAEGKGGEELSCLRRELALEALRCGLAEYFELDNDFDKIRSLIERRALTLFDLRLDGAKFGTHRFLRSEIAALDMTALFPNTPVSLGSDSFAQLRADGWVAVSQSHLSRWSMRKSDLSRIDAHRCCLVGGRIFIHPSLEAELERSVVEKPFDMRFYYTPRELVAMRKGRPLPAGATAADYICSRLVRPISAHHEKLCAEGISIPVELRTIRGVSRNKQLLVPWRIAARIADGACEKEMVAEFCRVKRKRGRSSGPKNSEELMVQIVADVGRGEKLVELAPKYGVTIWDVSKLLSTAKESGIEIPDASVRKAVRKAQQKQSVERAELLPAYMLYWKNEFLADMELSGSFERIPADRRSHYERIEGAKGMVTTRVKKPTEKQLNEFEKLRISNLYKV